MEQCTRIVKHWIKHSGLALALAVELNMAELKLLTQTICTASGQHYRQLKN